MSMDMEIKLPVQEVERPKGAWKSLPDDFADAVRIVQECASNDNEKFTMTCVHIHPKWIEACDVMQMTRYKIATGVDDEYLIKRDTLKHVASLGMAEFCETKNWVHFRAGEFGPRLSCRRYVDTYPNLRPIYRFSGTSVQFPSGVEDAVVKASVFSSENIDNDRIEIEIRDGEFKVVGRGNSGTYQELKNCNYDGPPIRFTIPPKLFNELVKRDNICEIGDNKLKINGGNWVYVASLLSGSAEEDGE